MKVCLNISGDIILRPETDFECEYLDHYFPREARFRAFVSHGPSEADVVGLKIMRVVEEE